MAEPRTERAEAARPPAWWRQALRSFAELLALSGLAVTQPLLDVFGQAPDFFVYREADRFDLIAFAVLVALVPAAVLWTVEQLIGLAGASARRVAHLVFVGGLFVLFGLQSLKSADVASGPMLVALASVGGVVAVLAYWRWAGVRTWLAYLAISPFLFVGLFLTTSQASDLLESQEVAAAEVAPIADPPSVVVLQFDEWPLSTLVNRNGQIDRRLYPNLAELAGDGVWYRNATTAATFTTYAVPAILTGRQPEGERSAIASEYPESLFTLLGGQFDLDVIESVTHLCPTNLCDGELLDGGAVAAPEAPASEPASASSGLGQLLTDARQTYQAMVSPDPDATAPAATFQEALAADAAVPPTTTSGLDPEAAAEAARTTTTTTAPPGPPETLPGGGTVPPGGFAAPPMFSLQSVDDTIAGIEEGEDPTLHFMHLLLPHTPYKFLPGGRQYSQDSGGLSAPLPQAPSGRPDQPAAVDFEHQRLLLQASYADRVVGQVMDRLRETGLYDDAIVVVVADHGIGLQPGGAIRAPVGDELASADYADLLYVPLIIKAPDLDTPGTVSDANVMTIDILPTVAAALGIDMPWTVDGIDLATETRPDPAKETHVVFLGGEGDDGLRLGEALSFDGTAVQAEMLARNIDSLLRADNPAFRPYDIDDAGEIVGSLLDQVAVVGATGATVTLAEPESFDGVDLSSGFVPTHFVADVAAEGTEPLTVAVVVNGRVAAVSPTWPSGDNPHHLEAMLVPDVFHDGTNTVDLYLVGGTEGARTLAPIPRA